MGALMARKDLLKDLIAGAGEAVAPSSGPRMTRGAIGAVSQSIADLKSRPDRCARRSDRRRRTCRSDGAGGGS